MTVDVAAIEAVSIPHAPAATPLRVRSQLIAASLFAGGSIMGMLAIIGIYLSARHTALAENATWIPAGGLPLTAPNVGLFTLLLSIPAMLWVQQAIRNDDRQSLWVASGIVVLLSAAFINAQSFILTNLHLSGPTDPSVGITDSNVTLLIFTVVGLHLLMLSAATIAVIVNMFRTLGGRGDGRNRDSVDAVALYWYATVAVSGIIWYAIYVTK